MAKDPATLWYWNDWIGGTMTMTRQEKGAYMDLLTAQFNSGHLTETQIRKLLGNDQGLWGTVLREKFVVDGSGSYFNQRLEDEINKRKKHSAKQRDTALKRWTKEKECHGISDGISHGITTAMPLVIENENKEGIGGMGEREGVPIGSEIASEVANEVWKDKRWCQNICTGQYIKLEDLQRWMSLFNASICNDVMPDFSASKYKKIFNGWLSNQRSKGRELPATNQPQPPSLKIPEYGTDS